MKYIIVLTILATVSQLTFAKQNPPCTRPGLFSLNENSKDYYGCYANKNGGLTQRYLSCPEGEVFVAKSGVCEQRINPNVLSDISTDPSNVENPTVPTTDPGNVENPTIPPAMTTTVSEPEENETTIEGSGDESENSTTSKPEEPEETTTTTDANPEDTTTTTEESEETTTTEEPEEITTTTEEPEEVTTTTEEPEEITTTKEELKETTNTTEEPEETTTTTENSEITTTTPEENETTTDEPEDTSSTISKPETTTPKPVETTSPQEPEESTTTTEKTETTTPKPEETTTDKIEPISTTPEESTTTTTEKIETTTTPLENPETTTSPKPGFVCPTTGFFPQDGSCNQFNYCTEISGELKSFTRTCPEGQNFNPIGGYCTANYDCSSFSKSRHHFECLVEGTFVYPNDCSKYYKCTWNNSQQDFTSHVLKCPVDQVYHMITGMCGTEMPLTCLGRNKQSKLNA